MIKQRFIIDDCGTLIDVVTGKHYDYVSDVVDVMNDLDSENTHLKYSLGAYMVDLNNYKGKCSALEQENEKLKHELLCRQLDKAPTEPINCKCYYKECDFE